MNRWALAIVVVVVLSAINGCMTLQDIQATKEWKSERHKY